MTEKDHDKELTVTYNSGERKSVSEAELLDSVWMCHEERDIFDKEHIKDHGSHSPIRPMQAVFWHMELDRPLPPNLKKWFLDGLQEHTKQRGEKTFDQIFGYTGKESTRNAYTSQTSESDDALFAMTVLCNTVVIKKARAARLAVWRAGSSIEPESVERLYRKKTTNSEFTGKIFWRECRQENKDFCLKIFDSFITVEGIPDPATANDLRWLSKIAERVKATPASELFEYTTESQKPD